ncbi:hypothetical protein GGR53DRAFT_529935 [Hypoxylon sp. FL1150]|nr:hypothetical protein GGR53DRAFT_529935 [Hypoxylon sp. FL1150]
MGIYTILPEEIKELVVLSCGTLGTSSVLERSGVGDPKVLKEASITAPPVVELPGVGHDYQDHNISRYICDKILGWNGIDAWTKMRPKPSEIEALGPASKEAWDKDFKDPMKPLGGSILSTSRAHVTGSGLDDPLDFKSGYLTDKHGLDLNAPMAINLGELPYRNPAFRSGSSASYAADSVGDGASPAASNPRSNIEYSSEDDAMAPRDRLGVVDSSLGVYGVTGLKIADLGIAPENVCSNTMTTALAIGEKVADIFIQV